MEFIKERNLIVCYEDNMRLGAWDITTGNYIGKSGRSVQKAPACFNYNKLPSIRYTADEDYSKYLAHAIYCYRSWISDRYEYNEIIGKRFEQLISVGLFPLNRRDLNYEIKLNKNIIKYLKENNQGLYDYNGVINYNIENQYKDYIESIPDWAKSIFYTLMREELPFNYVKTALNRALNEKIYAFSGEPGSYNGNNLIVNVITKYYKMNMEMYKKVEVIPNLLSKYAILRNLYEEYKKAHYNDVLKKNNDLPWLYYENDVFVVRPIITKEGFHDEAAAQNNCVERMYMERVYNKQTHIVTVRRKANPENAFITCEVSNDGQIIQYLGRFNRWPTETDAVKFRTEYQTHLCLANKE